MMPKIKDLTGQTFGRLTVVSLLPNRSKSGNKKWRCRCSCGKWAPAVVGSQLSSGKTKSCGCLRIENGSRAGKASRVHGLSEQAGNAHYTRWAGIKQRTGNPRAAGYSNYGGRGIKMYQPWCESFIMFKNWIDKNLGPCPDGFSLDRIDNDKGYAPHNLRWASAKQQVDNRRK